MHSRFKSSRAIGMESVEAGSKNIFHEQKLFLAEMEGKMEMGLVRKSLLRKQHKFLAELEARMEVGEVEVNMSMLNITAKPEEKQEQKVDGNSKNKLVNNEVEEWDLGFGSLQVSDPSAQKDKLRAAGEVVDQY